MLLCYPPPPTPTPVPRIHIWLSALVQQCHYQKAGVKEARAGCRCLQWWVFCMQISRDVWRNWASTQTFRQEREMFSEPKLYSNAALTQGSDVYNSQGYASCFLLTLLFALSLRAEWDQLDKWLPTPFSLIATVERFSLKKKKKKQQQKIKTPT